MTSSTEPARNVTMQDIADIVGVSKAAVSQTFAGRGRISKAKRQTILETARKLGFEPDPHARRLSTGSFDNLIGLFSLDLDLGTETLKLSHIQQLLMERGFDVSLHAFGFLRVKELSGTEALLRQLCRLKPRAIICNTRDLHEPVLQLLKPYQESGGIVICYDYPVQLACDQVIFDRANNATLATRYLLKAGHRRIGIHPGHRYPRDKRFIPLRLAGFKSTLKESNVPLRKNWIFYSERTYEEAGQDIAEQFLALPIRQRPSALYIVNDRTAAAFVHTVMRQGVKVPEELSIVSDDDLPSASTCYVPLTAVSQPVQQIAKTVVQLLEERLKNPEIAPRYNVIKGKLISRRSVAKNSA
jgi:LacI family transcriptional regulator